MISFPSKAMILAAGLGERLRPLTLTTPKPLIEIAGRPLLEYNLTLLKKFGVKEVMINLYHLGEQIKKRLGDGKHYGLKIFYSEEKEILGTGGGVKKVEEFFGDKDFFMLNADILIDLDLKELYTFHSQNKFLATLVTISAYREDIEKWVFWNSKNEIVTIDKKSPSISTQKGIFSGVQVINKEMLFVLPHPYSKVAISKSSKSTSPGATGTPLRIRGTGKPRTLDEEGPWHADSKRVVAGGGRQEDLEMATKSCIIQDGYIPLLREKKKLGAYIFKGYWRDLGTLERYQEVREEFAEGWPYTTFKPADLASL